MMVVVGYGVRVITPSLAVPVFLAGFGRNRRATAVHDDLYARALALAEGATQVVVVAVDLIGLPRSFCQAVERRVQAARPGAQLLIAATHTHHGPDTLGLWGPDEATSGVDRQYMAALEESLVATALDALGSMRPATLRRTVCQVAGVAKNARNPDVKDETLSVLQFCGDEDGRPLATLLVYPCHPEVLWDENPHITADYCASLRTTVEAATGAPALALVGALGGMMTPDMGANNFAAAEAMGAILGQAALAALADAPLGRVRPVHYARCEFEAPLENPLFHLAMAAGLLADARNVDGTLTTEASLLRVGDAWLLGVPGELFPQLGLAYKAQMAGAGAVVAAVVGLANDELGYILPAEEFVYPDDPFAPGEHYEETMSISREACPRLAMAVGTLLRPVAS